MYKGGMLALLLVLAWSALTSSSAEGVQALDQRKLLASKTRYALRHRFPDAPDAAALADPPGYTAVSLWLLSRHGTRFPTKGRMQQVDSLAQLFPDATNTAQHPWIEGWRSPFEEEGVRVAHGELHDFGEQELWSLGHRLAQRYPSVPSERYLPRRFPIVCTQESRTAASANAFASGFFPEAPDCPSSRGVRSSANQAQVQKQQQGRSQEQVQMPAGTQSSSQDSQQQQQALSSGGRAAATAAATAATAALSASTSSLSASSGDDDDGSCNSVHSAPRHRPRAVAVNMAPMQHDPLLRFFDTCPSFTKHAKRTKAWLSPWQQQQWAQLVPALEQQLGMTRALKPKEVEALFQLCVVEAGLENDTSKACALFDAAQLDLMEWVEDVSLWELRGYGSPSNFKIASVLMADLHTTLKSAAGEKEPMQRARLLFAHEETIIPMATLMGLFQEPGAEAPDEGQGQDYEDDTVQAARALTAGTAAEAATRMSSASGQHGHAVATAAAATAAVPLPQQHGQQQQQQSRRHRAFGRRALAHEKAFFQIAGEELRVEHDATSSTARQTAASTTFNQRPADDTELQQGSDQEMAWEESQQLEDVLSIEGHEPPPGWTPPVPRAANRTWRSSRIGPYGANMVLVLYRAEGQSGRPQHLVRLIYNEQVLPIPRCNNQPSSSTSSTPAPGTSTLDCPLEQFLEAYAPLADPSIMAMTCVLDDAAAGNTIAS